MAEDVFLWGVDRLDPVRREPYELFCGFAAAARKLAADRSVASGDRLRELELLDAALDAPLAAPLPVDSLAANAARMADRLRDRQLNVEGLHRIAQACRRDAPGLANRSWGELLIYAQFAAAPYGRFLLDLHRENESCRRGSEALSVGLMLTSRLSDLGELYRRSGQIALPGDWIEHAGIDLERSLGAAAPPALLECLGQALDRVDQILNVAASLPSLVRDENLRRFFAYQFAAARRLARALRTRDPWAAPVRLGRWQRFLVRLASRKLARRRGEGEW